MQEGHWSLNAGDRLRVDQLHPRSSQCGELCSDVGNFKTEMMEPLPLRLKEARDATGLIRWRDEFNLGVTSGEEGDAHLL